MNIFRFRINKIYLWSQIVFWGYLPGEENFLDSIHKQFPNAWQWVKNRARKVVNDKDRGTFIVKSLSEIPRYPTEVRQFFTYAFHAKEFGQIMKETEAGLIKVEKEWQRNQKSAISEFRDIVRLKFDPPAANVFITHPALPNGRNYPSKNAIGWGYRQSWKNYNTVYLLHEFLHLQVDGKFRRGNIMHAIIELATDNELRVRLNGKGTYFEDGHSGLRKLEKKIYPFWQEYLKDGDENILQFNRRMERLL